MPGVGQIRRSKWAKLDERTHKYFVLAGLELTATSEPAPGTTLGINTQMIDGKLMVVDSTTAGLKAGDQILEVEGAKATPKVLSDILAARTPGDRLLLRLARSEVQVTLAGNVKRTYSFRTTGAPTAILDDWLRASTAPKP
jgi:hypothetical protein